MFILAYGLRLILQRNLKGFRPLPPLILLHVIVVVVSGDCGARNQETHQKKEEM